MVYYFEMYQHIKITIKTNKKRQTSTYKLLFEKQQLKYNFIYLPVSYFLRNFSNDSRSWKK